MKKLISTIVFAFAVLVMMQCQAMNTATDGTTTTSDQARCWVLSHDEVLENITLENCKHEFIAQNNDGQPSFVYRVYAFEKRFTSSPINAPSVYPAFRGFNPDIHQVPRNDEGHAHSWTVYYLYITKEPYGAKVTPQIDRFYMTKNEDDWIIKRQNFINDLHSHFREYKPQELQDLWINGSLDTSKLESRTVVIDIDDGEDDDGLERVVVDQQNRGELKQNDDALKRKEVESLV